MKQVNAFEQVDAVISSACSQFVEQARLLLPLDRMAVVLLDTEGATSRVVFSWRAVVKRANPTSTDSLALTASSQNLHAVAINVPLYDGDGQMGEVLCRSNAVPGFSPEEKELLHQLAEQLAIRLENANLSQRLQAREEEIAAVDESARIITSTLDIDQVYAKFATELRNLVDFDRAQINLIDYPAGVVIVQYLFGAKRPGREVDTTSPLEGSQAHYVSTTGQTLIREIPGSPPLPADQHYHDDGLRSFITVPLTSKGSVIGTLGLCSRRSSAYGLREQAILERLASQIAPVVENAQLYDKIQANISEAENRLHRMAPNLEAQVDLAHLLRTPLTSIKGYTSSLLRSDMTWPPELQREFLQTIEQATDQLNQTVSDLLTPTRSVPDEIQLLRSEITIQRLLEQAKADLDGENWPAPLHLGWDPDLPPVLVDHQRVRQVISHLIRCVGDPVAPVYLAARHQDGQPTIIIEPVDSNHLSNGPWQKFWVKATR